MSLCSLNLLLILVQKVLVSALLQRIYKKHHQLQVFIYVPTAMILHQEIFLKKKFKIKEIHGATGISTTTIKRALAGEDVSEYTIKKMSRYFNKWIQQYTPTGSTLPRKK
jgi:hypothetical protein